MTLTEYKNSLAHRERLRAILEAPERRAELTIGQQEALKRNDAIRNFQMRLTLDGDARPTGLLTSRELHKEIKAMSRSSRLQKLWARLTAMFNKGEAAI
jgi:hypothetical protein